MRTKNARRRRTSRRRVLLVIDMLNGFLDPKGALYCGDDARRIVPFVRRKIEAYRRTGNPVVFICDHHAPNDPEFKVWGRHCVRGTWESQIIPELTVNRSTVIRKHTLSCFYGTTLQRKLRSLAPDLVEVVGVCTNICVIFAAAELRTRNYRVRVLKKGCATFERKAHKHALEQITSAFGAEVA